jgi:hypothetical protein
MGIVPGQRPVAPAWAALLVVGAALVLVDLARVVFLDLTGSDRPSDRGGAALWNGPADPTNRCLVRGRALPLATVWGVEPHQAGQPGGGVLVRDGRMAPGWLFGAALTPTGVSWAPGRVRRSVRDRPPERRRRRRSQRHPGGGRDPHPQRPPNRPGTGRYCSGCNKWVLICGPMPPGG